MFRLNSGFLPSFEEALETLVLETLDHTPKRNPLRYTTQSFLRITLIQRHQMRSGVCATMPKACAKNRGLSGVRWNFLLGHPPQVMEIMDGFEFLGFLRLGAVKIPANLQVKPEIC